MLVKPFGLLHEGANIAVDFAAEGNFNDLRGLPRHGVLLWCSD
jgi:hypothetical protein